MVERKVTTALLSGRMHRDRAGSGRRRRSSQAHLPVPFLASWHAARAARLQPPRTPRGASRRRARSRHRRPTGPCAGLPLAAGLSLSFPASHSPAPSYSPPGSHGRRRRSRPGKGSPPGPPKPAGRPPLRPSSWASTSAITGPIKSVGSVSGFTHSITAQSSTATRFYCRRRSRNPHDCC
ncbi:hypothetical protein VTK26DRAFT_4498 [Humicola hyalothermophila]